MPVDDALFTKWARAPRLLVASDYDGTLSEIASSADAARAADGALAVIERLAESPGVSVAILSGRTMDSLKSQLGGVAAWLAGEHGARIERPGGAPLVEEPQHDPGALAALVAHAERIARVHAGMTVERKSTGVAVHYRAVAAADLPAVAQTLRGFREAAARASFGVLDGRKVVEARASTRSKATALEAIMGAVSSADTNAAPHVVYAGDDTTDVAALELARAFGGSALYVASAERPDPGCPVDALLDGPAEWIALLGALVEARITCR